MNLRKTIKSKSTELISTPNNNNKKKKSIFTEREDGLSLHMSAKKYCFAIWHATFSIAKNVEKH